MLLEYLVIIIAQDEKLYVPMLLLILVKEVSNIVPPVHVTIISKFWFMLPLNLIITKINEIISKKL